jgi:phosphotransferase system  glucose/maltose/N-acetylglucosamine-specific IIC component
MPPVFGGGRRGNSTVMIGVALAMIIVGIIFLFVIAPVGIAVGIVGLVLFVLALLGFGRRAATTEQPQP